MSRVICTHIVLHIEQTRSQLTTGFVCKDEKSGMILLVLSIGIRANVLQTCKNPSKEQRVVVFFLSFLHFLHNHLNLNLASTN